MVWDYWKCHKSQQNCSDIKYVTFCVLKQNILPNTREQAILRYVSRCLLLRVFRESLVQTIQRDKFLLWWRCNPGRWGHAALKEQKSKTAVDRLLVWLVLESRTIYIKRHKFEIIGINVWATAHLQPYGFFWLTHKLLCFILLTQEYEAQDWARWKQ